MIETIFKAILITMVIAIILGVINGIAIDYNLSIAEYTSTLSSFFAIVLYLLPFNKLLPIFTIVIAFEVYKIAISILKTLWQIFNFA